MKTKEILNYLEKKIHSVIIATVDDKGLPVTCAIDIMDGDENGLYFLTAKGKGFYNRLKKSGYAALTGMNGRYIVLCGYFCPWQGAGNRKCTFTKAF